MSILIRIEEYFRKRKLDNQKKIFNSVQNILREINIETKESDGLVHTLSMACDYNTLYATLCRIINSLYKIKKVKSDKAATKYYNHTRRFCGFLKFLLDFYGGYIGCMWL